MHFSSETERERKKKWRILDVIFFVLNDGSLILLDCEYDELHVTVEDVLKMKFYVLEKVTKGRRKDRRAVLWDLVRFRY